MNGRLIGLSLGIAAMNVACQSTPEPPPPSPPVVMGSVGDPYASLSESDVYVQLGVQYMEQGSYDVALKDLTRALDEDGDNSEAHNAMGVLFERLNRLPDAEIHFRKALDLNADNNSARNNYGRYLCARGRTAEGLQQIQTVVNDPLYRQPWIPLTNAGLCLRGAGRAAEAEGFFRRALERNPQFSPALLELAKLSFAARRYPTARGFLERYRGVARPTPESLWLAAQTELALGDRESAETYLGQLHRHYPDSGEARAAAGLTTSH
jgi:type IV pilus assembly protein PilF